ncbi:dephospho-CoA kinase [Candidatus Albibeggiatoa sp. nov. BB20]|uniref:dephospho-CoA kinase n=1 Tax=Candidatus Albibeggiatoa sp. nov. BB20 TaxID=3162723 RepID=UPI003365842A
MINDNCSSLKIGLTGGIASGKTTISDLFAQQGVPIIDADVIAHQLVQVGQPALATIAQVFGHDILHSDGSLDRGLLREKVFAKPQQREQLEAILHPLVYAEITQQAQQSHYAYCIVSIPLLVETWKYAQVDRVLVVDCTDIQQRQRLRQRNQFDDKIIDQILAAQATRQQRLAIANDIIQNNNSLEYLATQVCSLHLQYLQLATIPD